MYTTDNLHPDRVDDQIHFFFRTPPDKGAGHGNQRSIMFLLRRDLRDLTAHEGRRTANRRLRAPVLASFGIMVGYEILARIWAGKNVLKKKHLKHIYREMLGISADKANLMVQFRNALGHAYHLSITDKDDGKVYKFVLGVKRRRKAWFRKTGGQFRVDFWELRWRFLEHVKRIQQRLLDRSENSRRNSFLAVLEHLQPIRIIPD